MAPPSPEELTYANIDRAAPFKIMPGTYTRFGNVTELVRETDDCFVIFGHGEELTLREALARVAEVAFFSVEFIDGANDKCVDTPSIFTGSNIYKTWDTTGSKQSAYTSGVIKSEHIFGGSIRILQSSFCINIFDSTNLKGCFEVDGSYSSRDSYFCHNCENVNDAMFCFNTKAMSYAFCNEQVGKAEYVRLKRILLDYVNRELEEKGELDASIFNLTAKKKKK